MTSTTMKDAILLHHALGDPIRTRLADVMRASMHDLGTSGTLGESVGIAARQLGVDLDNAYARLGIRIETGEFGRTPDGDYGFTMSVIPDGVRACYKSECSHGPDYTAPSIDEHQRT